MTATNPDGTGATRSACGRRTANSFDWNLGKGHLAKVYLSTH
ncbi:hypothetical protein [Amycolatopsis jiangsuensis]|uniref:Uncharacterized protein n=1 Tax=Amycolatopsis jiangsuensis TaxID=1181879 RepID=A0A840IXQ3_9PSEU|nr:hypothetical protein [Amycolatopsis jiangsuensis]MBB4686175.1 hypothetical protein [Amycolatopsis jiangsuensis]